MWKDVKNYENRYEVNTEGVIRNKKTKRILKPELCKGGYLRVRLYKNNKDSKHELVHRVVAKTFLDNTHNYKEVNHKDNNPKNNNVSNLEWCTSQYNSRYSKAVSVIMIHPLCFYERTFNCIRDAEKETGVNNASISRCCRGKQKLAGGFIWRYSKKEVEI